MRKTLRVSIGHAPVLVDPPGLNTIDQPLHAQRFIEGLVPVRGDLCARRLNLTDLVSAARLELRFVSVPIPLIGKTGMGHTLWRSLELSLVPFLAAVGRHFHQLDRAATGPGQAADLVETLAGQLLSARRERDDRLGPDLVTQCRLFLFLVLMKMPKIVVVHVVLIDDLDSSEPLGVKNALEAGY